MTTADRNRVKIANNDQIDYVSSHETIIKNATSRMAIRFFFNSVLTVEHGVSKDLSKKITPTLTRISTAILH